MRQALTSIRDRMDGVGVLLSGLCAVHCILGLMLVGILGVGGQFLLAPEIHRFGLALAVVIGFVSIGLGVLRHGRLEPLVLGVVGLSFMAAGLVVEHGLPEAIVTILGVALVALAHIRNLHKSV
ncbi:MerC domain-containing protein [Novosphingobium sp. M1R2S20]|uniref:MerC domain-containing protein n=1 Tax=Novosphingobium rhizovicinum TaxID=3228928 RepID=A0ABV3R9T7_9SPHN